MPRNSFIYKSLLIKINRGLMRETARGSQAA